MQKRDFMFQFIAPLNLSLSAKKQQNDINFNIFEFNILNQISGICSLMQSI